MTTDGPANRVPSSLDDAARMLLFKLEYPPDQNNRPNRLKLIVAALAEAASVEREACAKLAEAESVIHQDSGIAAGQICEAARLSVAIRARK